MNNMFFKRKFLPRGIVEICIEYYEQNDIFLNKSSEYFDAKQNLLNKKNISYEDMEEFIINTRGNKHTKFYRSCKNKVKTESYIMDIYFKNTLYVKPNLWNTGLYTDLIKIFKDVKKENLILDLRGCSGGYLKQCVNICNLFLAKSEIVSLKYIDKIVTYYSKEQMYKFKSIFILVDKNTASSAEILSYSLYANLDNVRLIGEKTYGKTFGQDFIINNKYKFCLSIPSFKWSINNFSIDEAKIVSCDDHFSMVKSLLFPN